MDKLTHYRQVINGVISNHAKYRPSHGQIETLPLCDVHNDNYLLLDLGWDKTGRVHSVAIHIRLKADKIWIEWDGTETGITDELLVAGIAKEDIVLGFYRPERREITGFAVA